jgi:RNA polymerase sigma-70 factor (ECF subfamily)
MLEQRFDEFNQYRRLLFSIAYRMLGSVADAEDVLQDAFVRWQQRPGDQIESPRKFLVTIVSRLCLNYLKSARVRRENYVGQWLPEPLVVDSTEPVEEYLAGESISMAFMVLLERLNPIERAVFILREVFEYGYEDIANIVNRTEEHCRQILHRAHQRVKRERASTPPSAGDHTSLLQSFIGAALHGDMDGLLKVLSQDVALYADGGGKARAIPNVVTGSDRVGRLLEGVFKKFVPAGATATLMNVNGEPAIVASVDGHIVTLVSIEASQHSIRNIFIISNPDKLAYLSRNA